MFALNYDCIKDILIYLQNNLEYTEGSKHKEISWYAIYTDESLCKTYLQEDIMYNIEKMLEADLIRTSIYKHNPSTREVYLCFIDDITMIGHDFLCNAQNETIWKNTKDKLRTFGKVSLPIFLKLLADEGMSFIKQISTK